MRRGLGVVIDEEAEKAWFRRRVRRLLDEADKVKTPESIQTLQNGGWHGVEPNKVLLRLGSANDPAFGPTSEDPTDCGNDCVWSQVEEELHTLEKTNAALSKKVGGGSKRAA
ncbi:unnamed protein product, partial [Discosporangium mesarthrocarpum]